MTNRSVWLYRDYFYWQLNGLPDKKPTLEGPFPIWWKGMAPVERLTHVMTVSAGEGTGNTFRFKRDEFWGFNPKGRLFIGSTAYGKTMRVPFWGLNAFFFNGDGSNPLMIRFRGMNVYYYRFVNKKWIIDGSVDGYVGGRYGENFPGHIDFAFAVPPIHRNDGYIAYLFKNGKYCRRSEKLKSGKDCEKWIDIKELYGCYSTSSSSGSNQLVSLKKG